MTDGIERFADDIGYVHLKDVNPVKDFAANRDALSQADFHLDNIINYFRSFTDLGDGIIDFDGLFEALEGQATMATTPSKSRTKPKPLVHAKQNYDYWQEIVASE